MAWREALAGMGFLHQGSVKGWRRRGDQVEVWYRVQNSLLGRSEVEALLGWALGIPDRDPLDPDVLLWPGLSTHARVSARENLTEAVVMGLVGLPDIMGNGETAMNFSQGETIH